MLIGIHHEHPPQGFGFDRYSAGCPLYSRNGLPDWDSRTEPPVDLGRTEDDWPARQVHGHGHGHGHAPR